MWEIPFGRKEQKNRHDKPEAHFSGGMGRQSRSLLPRHGAGKKAGRQEKKRRQRQAENRQQVGCMPLLGGGGGAGPSEHRQ